MWASIASRSASSSRPSCRPATASSIPWVTRRPPVQVVAAVAGDDHDAYGAEPGEEEAEQVTGGLVGPVDVLDDERDRVDRGEMAEGGQDRVEQLAALDRHAGVGRPAGQQAGQ